MVVSRSPSSILIARILFAVPYTAVAEDKAHPASPQPPLLDIIIAAGQSNAVGFDAHAKRLAPTEIDREIFFWWRCGDPPPDRHDSTSGGKFWTHLQVQPVGDPKKPRHPEGFRQFGNFADPDGGFGPEVSLARFLATKDGSPKLGIVKVAYGATSIAKDWSPERDQDGACYRALLSETRAAIDRAKSEGFLPRVRALVWIQGEADSSREGSRAYRGAFSKLIASIRRDLRSPELIILAGFNTLCFLGTNEFVDDVVAAQKAVADADPLCAYVDTSRATVANAYHWDWKGNLDVGLWFAEELLKLEDILKAHP